jgi:hypothetical protein
MHNKQGKRWLQLQLKNVMDIFLMTKFKLWSSSTNVKLYIITFFGGIIGTIIFICQ